MLRAEDVQTVSGAGAGRKFALAGASFLRSHRWVPFAVFATSILVTLTFWRLIPTSFRANEGSDYLVYYEPLARSLAGGNGLTVNGVPTVTHPPGYPLILAGIFYVARTLALNEETTLALFSALCMAAVSVLIFYLARAVWSKTAALVSSLIWLTYPFALWLTKQPNSEMPFMVVFYATLLLFWHAVLRRINRWPIYMICGVGMGVAMLIRPFAIGLGLTTAFALWLVRRDLSKRTRVILVSALLLGNAVAVLPWEAWAYTHTGQIVVLGKGGAGSMRDGLTFGINSKNYREANNLPSDIKEVMSNLEARLGPTDSAAVTARAVIAEARQRPFAMTKLFLLKAARSWYGTDSFRKEGWILLIQVLYLLVFSWSLHRVWRKGREARLFTIGVFTFVFYFWVMSIVGATLLRFTVPVTGLLFVLMSGAFSQSKQESTTLDQLPGS